MAGAVTIEVQDASAKYSIQKQPTENVMVHISARQWNEGRENYDGSPVTLTAFTVAVTAGTGTAPTIQSSGGTSQGQPGITSASTYQASFRINGGGTNWNTVGVGTITCTLTFSNGEIKTVPLTVTISNS